MEKIKLVVLDMDGTVVKYCNYFQSSWKTLLSAYGLGEIVKQNEKKYYKQKDKGGSWAREEAELLRGKSVKKALGSLFPVPYSPGAEDFLWMTKGKVIRGIITTGLGLVANRIGTDFNLDFVRCNTLHRKNGCFIGTIDYAVPLWKKDKVLEEVAGEYGVSFSEICCIGDNENDISLFEKVGLSIAFNPKTKSTARKADYVINHFKKLEKILLKNV